MNERLYFIGIGGSAMGSVAVAAATMGYTVVGSDVNVYPPMSEVLAQHGIHWFEGYSESNLLKANPGLVIVGNAISRRNPELEAVLNNRIPYTSMAAFVGEHLVARSTSIVVAGTHGKTSTSSTIALILEHAGRKPGFLIGGVPSGFTSGCRVPEQSPEKQADGIMVLEGDEYDTAFFDKRSKFVHYRPTIALLNNIEFDHADIFDDIEAVKKSFKQFVRIVPSNGCIIANADDSNVMDVLHAEDPPVLVESFGFAPNSTWQIHDVVRMAQGSEWSLNKNGTFFGRFSTELPGEHTIRNCTAAIVATHHLGVSTEQQQSTLAKLALPKRRLEVLTTWNGRYVIDDFAHHPTAIRVTVDAIAQRYPNGAIAAVFEPRSNTSTRSVFQSEFATCFRGASSVIIGPINRPERYSPEERLNTEELQASLLGIDIQCTLVPNSMADDPSWGTSVVNELERATKPGDVILLLSNGNIGSLRQILKQDNLIDKS